MNHLWNITGGTFRPSFASDEKHGSVIITAWNNHELIEAVIANHRTRAKKVRPVGDYCFQDYGDELEVFFFDGKRWRCLVHLQYEGLNA